MSEKKENGIIKQKIDNIDTKIFEIFNKGVKSWYQYKKCQTNLDTEQTFHLLLDLLEDAKVLLFDDGKKYDIGLLKEIEKALEICPRKVIESVSYKEIGDEKHPIIKLTAEDAGTVECFPNDIEKTRIAFEKRQYQHYIPELRKVHIKLYHELVSKGIIKKDDPSVDEMIDDMIKEGIKGER